jgi:hypothetical protein
VIGESENISIAPGSDDRTTIYASTVRILKTYKGAVRVSRLKLTFRAVTTGIETSAKHLFFLRKVANGFEVIKSSYIYPTGHGYPGNHIRLFGATNSREDLGLDVIRYLANSKISKRLGELLKEEYRTGSRYAAVRLALATQPIYGGSVLRRAVQETERATFDIHDYGLAAYGLAIEKKKENWQLLLDNIPAPLGYGRVAESIVFDLAANFGGRDAAAAIKDAVRTKPSLAVSGAFALSKIGGAEARDTIENWLRDPALSERNERISSGWTTEKRTFSSLFREALRRMKEKN